LDDYDNYTDTDIFGIKQFFKLCEYGICGKEVGEEGTPHLQAYGRLIEGLTLAKVKKFLPRAHLIVAKGSDLDNKKYCSKDGDFFEVGEPSKEQGKRNDIHSVAQKIKAKEITIEDIMFDYPVLYMKYSRSLEKMCNAVLKARSTAPAVHWRYGLAGTGKTRYCVETHASSHYIKDNTPWWDGYTQQEAVIIDDFDNKIPFRTLLRILDRYEYLAQVKGSYIQLNSPYIYITCEYPPEEYWSGNELEQVKRRLTSVEEIK
jgi:hypothetical protein